MKYKFIHNVYVENVEGEKFILLSMLNKMIKGFGNYRENNIQLWNRISELENAVNALENQVKLLQQENGILKDNIICANNTIMDLHEPIEHISVSPRHLIADPSYDINKVYTMMEKKAPRAFGIYKKLMENGSNEYEKESSSDCAVEGDVKSIYFSKFIKRYLHGNVLDVGCGPIELPIYLQGYPTECIYGLDPLLPHKEHPFAFIQGVAEQIPWEDRVFDTVLFATSFDHVFLVDLVMAEVERVLADDGYLLIWVGFDENAKPYDPYASDFEPYDKFHMFHTTKQNFEDIMNRKFEIVEYCKCNANLPTAPWRNLHFYAMKKG